MKPLITLALLALVAGSAHAESAVKRLAQFDLGFAKCEARFAHMKGHRDEAYLALWKVRYTPAQRASLEQQRHSAKYQEERAKAQKALEPETPALEEKIRNQCQATWSELQRNRPPVAASQPKGSQLTTPPVKAAEPKASQAKK
ncbi:MAG: hypothetical protein ABW190_15260 [Rhizobacter sp.]